MSFSKFTRFYFALRPSLFALPTWLATPGLPLTEDFSDRNLMDVANSNARWSTEEMQMMMAFKQTQFGAFGVGRENLLY